MRFVDEYNGLNMGFYELNPFPGCNQIVISNHVFMHKENRGRGYGSLSHKKRLSKIKALGYDYSICTVKKTNEVEIHILEKNGWKFLDSFFNRETGHEVCLYGRRVENDCPAN